LLRLRVAKLREQAKRTGRRVDFRAGRPRGRDGMTVFDVDGPRLAPILLACAERNALEKAAMKTPQVVRYRGGPTWRASSELVLDDAEEPEPEWLYEPEENEFDPEAEAEAYWARRDEQEAAVHAAMESEIDRLERINAVRVANGLPPRPRPKRLRIVVPQRPGRES